MRDYTSIFSRTTDEVSGMGTSVAHDYTLDFSCYNSFYSKRSISPIGAPPHISTPNAGGCMVSRFLHDLIVMNRVDKTEQQVVYSVGGGKRLVAWEQENEETCVNFSRLIGFSEGIKFKLLIALSPGALACSAILTGVAVGTGLLLFESSGPALSCDSDSGSFPHDRLVAWSRSSAFEFDSNVTLADCYLSSTYLKPTDGARYVIDCDTEQKSKSFPFTKLLKKVYLP